MTWAEATDDQLRRAAAERVMGWKRVNGWNDGDDYEDDDGCEISMEDEEFCPDRDRNDLALVFAAAATKLGCGAGIWPAMRFQKAYLKTLDDPRAALVDLLYLLFPEGPK